MMFSKKRWQSGVAALTIGLVAVTMSGCGRSDAPPVKSDNAAGVIDNSPATGELVVWAQADQAAALPVFADEFMAKNPDLKITITPLPWDAAHTKYQTAIASGATPDMAHMGTTWMTDFSGAFSPVPKGIDTSVYFEGSLKTNEVNGQLLGIPWYVDTRVFYYRADLAEKAGYTEFPKTWDKFTQFTKDLQTKAGAKWGVTLPVSGSDVFQSMLMFPWSGGAKLTNADQTSWTLDTPEWIHAMDYYKSFFTDGIANPNPETGAGANESNFVSGATPVMPGGPSVFGSLTAAGGAGFRDKIGVGRVPADVSSTSFTGGGNLTVFKNAKNPDAAWKFARWLSSPEVQVRWQAAVGDLPAVKSAWKDPALANNPVLSVFGEQLQSTNAPPTVPTWTELSTQADKALEQIVRGGGDPATVMKNLQSQADSIGMGK